MNVNLLSRKFLLAVLCDIGLFVMLFTGKMTVEVFSGLFAMVNGSYFTANVAEKRNNQP